MQSVNRSAKSTPTRPLCLLRRRRKSSESRQSISGRGALLAPDVVQPQLGRTPPHLGRLQPNQRTDTVTATYTAPPLPGAAGACSAVKQLPKSVGAGNPHATFCGNRGRVTASGDPVDVETEPRPNQ